MHEVNHLVSVATMCLLFQGVQLKARHSTSRELDLGQTETENETIKI